MNKLGTLFILPNTLGGESISDIIPNDVVEQAISLRHFVVENIKSARRVLRKMDREFPIDESMFIEMNKRST
tara:strand:+ start:382 stop:597 length:216 start_codon:yes stop_codon:yes gene_type:complete